jgi:class 3 adenylate cyclase
VNTGARLMTVATAGEIVVGATTWALLADPTAGEPLGPVRVKGKREPVEAWRLYVAR